MRALLIGLAMLGVASTTLPRRGPSPSRARAALRRATGYYTNVDGHRVHRRFHAARQPAGASAQCRDGSYSFSEHHMGTCSHHGGVSSWL